MNATEQACLAIADISGYTEYLSGVELDHAQDILADLLNAVVVPLRPAFHVAKLEGDAIFLYSQIPDVDGSILLDTIGQSYGSFRRRLLSIQQATTCACNACLRIPELNLKFVVHDGDIIRHEVLGRQELVGSDVIVVHRLLKNTIVSTHDIEAYALFTDACLQRTDIDPDALGMAEHIEDVDTIGPIHGWVHDLDAAFTVLQQRSPTYVSPDEASWHSSITIDGAPVPLLWEWLTTPVRKIQWEAGFDDIREVAPPGGRRGVATETHCMHGDDVIMMEVVDWRPHHYVTSRGAFPNGAPFFVTDEIAVDGDRVVVQKSIGAVSEDTRHELEEVLGMFAPTLDTWLPRYAELVRHVWEQRPQVTEPDLPTADEDARLATNVGQR